MGSENSKSEDGRESQRVVGQRLYTENEIQRALANQKRMFEDKQLKMQTSSGIYPNLQTQNLNTISGPGTSTTVHSTATYYWPAKPFSDLPSHVTPSSARPTHVTSSFKSPKNVTPSSAGPSHVTTFSALPSYVTPSSTGSSHVTPSSTRSSHVTPSSAGPSHVTTFSASPSYVTPSSTEPSHVKPSSTRPSHVKPPSASPTHLIPSFAKPTKVTPSSAGLLHVSQSSAGPLQVTPSSTRSSHVTPSSTRSSHVTPFSAGPTNTIPSFAEPTNITPSFKRPTNVMPSSAGPSHVTTFSASPSYVTPSSTEPSHVKPSSTRPSHVKPPSASPTHLIPSFAKPTKVTPSSAGLLHVSPSAAGPLQVTPSSAGLSHVTPPSAEPSHVTPSSAGPSHVTPSSTGLSHVTRSSAGTMHVTPSSVGPNKRNLNRNQAQRTRSRSRANQNTRQLSGIVNCVTCNAQLSSHIYQCTNGHSSCDACRFKMARCGNCTELITDMRNITLESTLADITINTEDRIKCLNAKDGCCLHFTREQLQNHLKECPFNIIPCPVMEFSGDCSWKGTIRQLAAHFNDAHPTHREADVNKEMHIVVKELDFKVMHLVNIGFHQFLVHIQLDTSLNNIYMVTQYFGTNFCASKWSYEWHVYNKKEPRRKFEYTDICKSNATPVSEIVKSNNCSVMDKNYAKTFLDSGKLTFKFYIKKQFYSKKSNDTTSN